MSMKDTAKECKLTERGYYPTSVERVNGPRTSAGLAEDRVKKGWLPYYKGVWSSNTPLLEVAKSVKWNLAQTPPNI